MINVVIVGFYGHKNTGDEAILASLIGFLKNIDYSIKITVFSANPSYTKSVHGVDAIKRVVKFPEFFEALFKRLSYIRKCNLLIVGGGGLYNDNWHIIPYGTVEILIAKIFNKKIVIAGVEIGPYRHNISKILTRFVLKLSNMVIVRSRGSKDYLDKLKVDGLESADLTFLLDRGNQERGKKILVNNNIPTNKIVGICVRGLENSPKRKLNIQAIGKCLDEFIESNKVNLLFLPFQYPEDNKISQQLIEIMKNKNKIYFLNKELMYNEINDIICNLDFLIGMRLHSIIFAANNNIPFFAISYHLKVKNFCEMFTEVLPYVELDDIKEFKDFYGPLMKAYRNRKKFKEIISSDIQFLMEKAGITIKVLSDIIDDFKMNEN